VKDIEGKLTLHYFLHERGYNCFTIPLLTYKEIRQLLDGHKILHTPTIQQRTKELSMEKKR